MRCCHSSRRFRALLERPFTPDPLERLMTRNSNGVNVASSGSVIFASLIICFMLFLLLVAIDPQLDGLLLFSQPGFSAPVQQ